MHEGSPLSQSDYLGGGLFNAIIPLLQCSLYINPFFNISIRNCHTLILQTLIFHTQFILVWCEEIAPGLRCRVVQLKSTFLCQ